MSQTTLTPSPAPAFDADKFAKAHRRNNRALKKALREHDRDALLNAARSAVEDWNQPDSCWPDDWSDWQRALDDEFGFGVYLLESL